MRIYGEITTRRQAHLVYFENVFLPVMMFFRSFVLSMFEVRCILYVQIFKEPKRLHAR